MFFDSHCHLDRIDLSDYDDDFDLLLSTIEAEGVMRMVCIGVTLESFDDMYRLIENYEQVKPGSIIFISLNRPTGSAAVSSRISRPHANAACRWWCTPAPRVRIRSICCAGTMQRKSEGSCTVSPRTGKWRARQSNSGFTFPFPAS
jgi:hypothetical protein